MTLYELKEDVNQEDLTMIKPALLILFTRAILFCKENGIECRITSLISDRKDLKVSTKTHQEGRAIDISTKKWTMVHIQRFIWMMNSDYKEVAAISASDNIPRAAIYHDVGYGEHIHLQVRPNAPWQKFVSFADTTIY